MNTIEAQEILGRVSEVREGITQGKETFNDLSRKIWIDLTVSIGSSVVAGVVIYSVQHIPLLLASMSVSALGLTAGIRNFSNESKILAEQRRLLLRLAAMMPKAEEAESYLISTSKEG